MADFGLQGDVSLARRAGNERLSILRFCRPQPELLKSASVSWRGAGVCLRLWWLKDLIRDGMSKRVPSNKHLSKSVFVCQNGLWQFSGHCDILEMDQLVGRCDWECVGHAKAGSLCVNYTDRAISTEMLCSESTGNGNGALYGLPFCLHSTCVCV